MPTQAPNLSRPPADALWFMPLGGCGEIGMNLNLFGHDGAWLMVDCGITFEQEASGQNRVEMADPGPAASALIHLEGIIATHAHEDHIGALPYLYSRFPKTIYTTPFTGAVIEEKFRGHALQPNIDRVNSYACRQIGPFLVTWLPITHSTPETHALLIETPAGNLLHTADWKIDPNPVIGPEFQMQQFSTATLPPVTAMVIDSTNALKPGHSKSEQLVSQGLKRVIQKSTGRVIIGCFASNIARLQSIGSAAAQTQRHLALAGRSLRRMTRIAKQTGYLKQDFPEIPLSDLGYLPNANALVIATGSQGEPGAALSRLALDQHPDFALSTEDLVILSTKTIPGNEAAVNRMIKGLKAQGAEVIAADDHEALNLHASGHPNQEELDHVYNAVRPYISVPVHGEPEHLKASAARARQHQIPHQLVGKNGDLFVLSGHPSIQRGCLPAGRLKLDPQGKNLTPA